MPPAHFQGRLQLREFCRAQPQLLLNDLIGLEQRAQAAKLPNRCRARSTALLPDAGSQKSPVARRLKDCGPVSVIFPRPLRRRPIANTHTPPVCGRRCSVADAVIS
jgi:hypothetical protein